MPAAKGTAPWNASKGSGWTDKRGYRWLYVTENGRRRARREHRVLMEESLGRPLRPDELVHHINGNTSDNRLENLKLTEWGQHTSEHHNGTRHAEYSKQTQGVIARYREENNHLRLVNAELLEALMSLCEAERDDLNDGASAVWNQAVAAISKATGTAGERP